MSSFVYALEHPSTAFLLQKRNVILHHIYIFPSLPYCNKSWVEETTVTYFMQTSFKNISIRIFAYIMDRTAEFYSRPTYAFRGAGFPVYSGSRRQRGGSVLGSLKKFIVPFGKNLLKTGASQALGLAADVANDVMRGRSLKSSLIQHGKARAKNLGKAALAQGIQSVRGMVNNGTSPALRKRRNRSKPAPRRPTKKRRTTKRTTKSLF